ncbi:MAG: putative lipid II flippase FtsW [Thermoanaerobaculia bacterium]
MAKKLACDKVLFTVILLLLTFGLVMVYSASAPLARGKAGNPLFVRQCAAAALGLLAMTVLMHLPYRLLREPRVIWTLLGGTLLLLVAVLFQPSLNGTRRWFFFGPLSLQASELAKLAVLPFLAYQIDRKNEQVNQRDFLLPTLLVVGVVAALILAEPDLGTAALLVLVAAVLIFLAGLSLRYVAGAGVVLGALLVVAVFSADYRRARLLAFLSPESDPLGNGYQALQSLIAVGSGGLFGLGQGRSVQKLYFLPHPESDFIFSIVAEELGLLGALALLAVFGVLAWRGIRASLAAPDRFGRYLGLAITCLLVVQALINSAVAVALLPTKGIPLPFISYGGSSLIVALTLSGVLLNISEHG